MVSWQQLSVLSQLWKRGREVIRGMNVCIDIIGGGETGLDVSMDIDNLINYCLLSLTPASVEKKLWCIFRFDHCSIDLEMDKVPFFLHEFALGIKILFPFP